ncbi:hypothetical protein [Saccharopolyspora mangrovi]|uniref:IS110 family transposase n=1 Tax=Saccharopolyspora mangrovi TaxID=3082379 RepID=A0ABU6AFH5_9PSEU|nr:hypothetical protein [Saccharopolyspora sp. S2-29]MEB3370080.1 hypothetical protein [Saccharopolyspora sp. S2-29]
MLTELTARLDEFDGVGARLARELVERARQLTEQINALEAELRPLVRRLTPLLLAVAECGVLSAAMILGETAGAHRFRRVEPEDAPRAAGHQTGLVALLMAKSESSTGHRRSAVEGQPAKGQVAQGVRPSHLNCSR